MYPNGVNLDTFKKGFLTVCGYTINEEGVAQNLTGVVKDFIKKFQAPEAKISWDRSLLLDYMESQMLSHANGYMWFANSGAWGDVNNIIIGTDTCLMFILESVLTVFKVHRDIEKTNHYKTIINVLRNGIKRIRDICNLKVKILAIPGITF